jgi:large subunit ribosomal protein L25
MAETADKLELRPREVEGSRSTRRLRREGLVPGVIYGGDGDCVPFAVDARILRNTLAHAHAVIEVEMDGGKAQPVMVKDIQRHPVRGEVMHLDLLRVNMNKPIQAPVTLNVTGGDEAPGVVEGGILNQELREVQVEALPGDIPDTIDFDASGMEMNATVTLSELVAPSGITLLDDPEKSRRFNSVRPSLHAGEGEFDGGLKCLTPKEDCKNGRERAGEGRLCRRRVGALIRVSANVRAP